MDRGQIHGRTAISFLTLVTPATERAMDSADARSFVSFANPDSMTTPFSVSTFMLAASTARFSTNPALIFVVMPASSMYEPTVSWPRCTAQPGRMMRLTAANTAAVRSDVFM